MLARSSSHECCDVINEDDDGVRSRSGSLSFDRSAAGRRRVTTRPHYHRSLSDLGETLVNEEEAVVYGGRRQALALGSRAHSDLGNWVSDREARKRTKKVSLRR